MHSIVSYIFIITAFFISTSCTSKKTIKKIVPINSIAFVENINMTLSDVIEKAEREQKLIFLDFSADWCLPCQLMEEEVFTVREVYQYFNRNFINYKVDVDKTNGANLKLMYGAENLPTLLFLDDKGRVVERNDGTIVQTKLMQLAKSAQAGK